MGVREKWQRSWTYVKKMQFFLILIILAVTVAAIAVSILSSVSFLTKQNKQYVSEQLSAMTAEYDSILEQYKAVVFSLVMDKHVQNYCACEVPDESMNEEAGNVYATLLNVLYMQSNANFMAIINNKTGTYTYNGDMSIIESRFDEVWQKDYLESFPGKERGALRLSFGDNYYRDHKYTLTLYFPVYSVTNMVTEMGMVVINLDDSLLEHLNNRTRYGRSSLYLTDIDGTVVSNADRVEMGKRPAFADRLNGNSGDFWYDGRLVNYQRVGDWNYYLINEVPMRYLYQNCYRIVVLLLGVMFLVMGASLTVSGRLAQALYRPMNRVISKMNDVSSGNLRTRINLEDMDNDSRKLAQGFNAMMDEIDVLMEQVAEEQRQIAQMRFNSLQSQIQPHFLYNTLECIHWQALSDGNGEISTMVKAMAQYYRICLSEGKDIISLKMELEHVKNYLIIQNMRYEDIIELSIRVPEEYMDVRIPKITLQPLVENSLYHGIRVKEGRTGQVVIDMKEEGEDLFLIVEDNGQGMDEEKVAYINRHITEFDPDIGYGINNVNKRIEYLYGQGCGLHYSLSDGGGVKVTIHLKREGRPEDVSDPDCR